MKKTTKKLTLSRDTLRALEPELREAVGAGEVDETVTLCEWNTSKGPIPCFC